MDMVLDKKCEMCGGQLEISPDGMKAKCPYCGSTYSYSLPVTREIAIGLDRANNYRLHNMFDNAVVEYKTLLKDKAFENNAEAYWGLVLSEYGIEYVRDMRDDVYVPTCHRTVSRSIFDDENYGKAVACASPDMRAVYEQKAAEIDELQRSIKSQAEAVEASDVFICFKSTDNRAATKDRYIARRIYDELTKRGFRTFFSEVSLKSKLGSDYEPLIYKALTTAKAMILVATKEEYLDSPFVRNEWSRFLERKKNEPSLFVIPVFGDIDPSALPSSEQGVDLSKYPAGGYETDIADNLESRLGKRSVPKINEEIIEEYNRYNEINRVKLEKEYAHALRDVDTSMRRTKNAGKEYAAKAEETEKLGDYKNAKVLAADYRKKAETFTKAESKQLVRLRIEYLILSAAGIALCVLCILFMLGGSGAMNDFLGIEVNDSMRAEMTNAFIGVSAGIFAVVPPIFAVFSEKLRYHASAHRTETAIYAIAVALMLASTVVYFVTYGENESAESLSSAIIMTVFTVVMAALGALHVLKFVKPLKPQQ